MHWLNLKITEREVEEKRLTSNSLRKNNPMDFEAHRIDGLHNEGGDQPIGQCSLRWQ
jgi:hypothetical protein